MKAESRYLRKQAKKALKALRIEKHHPREAKINKSSPWGRKGDK